MRKVDLAVELQILSFYQRRRAAGPVTALVDDAGPRTTPPVPDPVARTTAEERSRRGSSP